MRLLKAREIECRVQQVKSNGVSLLLYKDARCDMAILDEEFGADRWQRKHELIDGKLYCSVGIKYGDEWVWKQDVGTESNTEKEKGQASDSFKRACFNIGIGRELYTAPFIWIPSDRCKIENGKCNTRFEVYDVQYNEYREICGLIILDARSGAVVYRYGTSIAEPPAPPNEEPKTEAPKTQKVITRIDKPEEKTEEPLVCERCGKPLKGVKLKSGEIVTVAEIVRQSKLAFDDAVYCCECGKKRKAEVAKREGRT